MNILFYSIERFQNSLNLNYSGTFSDKIRSKVIYKFSNFSFILRCLNFISSKNVENYEKIRV